MSHTQQCVLPEECVCEVAGVRYWPGQQLKVDCEICVCERGRPQRCRPNPDCSGWQSISLAVSIKSIAGRQREQPHTVSFVMPQ